MISLFFAAYILVSPAADDALPKADISRSCVAMTPSVKNWVHRTAVKVQARLMFPSKAYKQSRTWQGLEHGKLSCGILKMFLRSPLE